MVVNDVCGLNIQSTVWISRKPRVIIGQLAATLAAAATDRLMHRTLMTNFARGKHHVGFGVLEIC